MRYPNQRYGSHEHFQHYAAGWKIDALAKHLKRDKRTVKDWLSGTKKLPWWVPEIMRLERYEKFHQMQQMGINPALAKLGIVRGDVLAFPDIHQIRERIKNSEPENIIKEQNNNVIKKYKK